MELTITLIIVIITCLVSFGGLNNPNIQEDLIFHPPAVTYRNQYYRFFSCGLIHGDYFHLIFNMVSLWSFGRLVELAFIETLGMQGKWVYLLLYVTALFVALIPTYARHKTDYHYRSLGASGAVSAVIFAGLMLFPHAEVGFFFIPPIIPGFVFGPLYLLVSTMMDRRGGDNINHSAHIWGALYGILFIIVAWFVAGQNIFVHFWESVQYYFRAKGWMQ